MKSPYLKDRSPLFGEVYRPIVEFEVKVKPPVAKATGVSFLFQPISICGLKAAALEKKVNDDWIQATAILDSGADVALLPRSFLEAFGFEPRKEEVKEARGIGERRIIFMQADCEIVVEPV